MPKKQYQILRGFKGVNRAVSKRDSAEYLQTCENMDSNLEEGMLISRLGSTKKQSSGTTPSIDKFVMYRDDEWGKDVLLVYSFAATAADRKIYVYTRTAGTDNSFAPHTTASYAYGSLRFGSQLTFLVHRNTVRIGTGTASTNKAMFMGYINREVGSTHDAMFNDAVSFSDMFLLKQQWVQQESLVNHGHNFIYDSTREKYYVLTTLGVEIRDSNFYTERILTDVRTWETATTNYYIGGLALTGNSLYALGKIANSDDTRIVLYDLTDDYKVDASADFDSSSNEYGHFITTDGNFVYVTWYDGTNGYIAEYAMDLASSNDRYTGAGAQLYGLTYDATHVYCCDNTNGDIIQMLIANPYTAVKFATAVTPIDIDIYGGDLYWTTSTVVYATTPATPFDTSTKAPKYTDANQYNESISFIGAIPYLSQQSGRIVYFDGVTNFNEAGYIPTKISMGEVASAGDTYANMSTYFYAFSIVDIYGQESHLHRGVAVLTSNVTPVTSVKISVNVDSENFAEMTSPSTDVDEELSVWNEFRRIKKIRVYRAYNDDPDASEPTTDYTFLREIDINDTSWTTVTANALYTFVVKDETLQADISTVTYEESSGLPEVFKPYYTNWQYGTSFEERYYYGNVFTDELNYHQIIQTPINAPDVAYQHDENIDYYYTADGDAIQGFAQVWNRMVIFKENNVAIYNELKKESTYNIGLSAPNSVLVYNNVVYFVYQTGIYALTPSGYKRISEPVDDLLQAESSTNLALICAVHFKEKMKLWWLIPGRDSFLYNTNKDTWDVYDISPGTRDVAFIGKGLDDTIYTTDSYDGFIYKENVGYTDGGDASAISITFTTNDIPLGDGYYDVALTRLFLTATSTDTLPVVVGWKNRNGSHTSTKTFAASSTLSTLKMYLSSAWGQYVKFSLTKSITAEVRIDSLEVEYHLQGKLQDAS